MSIAIADCGLQIRRALARRRCVARAGARWPAAAPPGRRSARGDAAMRAGNLDEAVAAVPQGGAGGARQRRTTRSRCSARCWRRRARTSTGRSEFESRISSRRRSASTRLATEYDPSNRTASAKVAELDRTIRDRIEASRPRPAIQRLRERARAASRRADAQPGVARAAEHPLQQRQPARHPERDRRSATASTSLTTASVADRPATVNSTASRSSRRSTRS